MVAGGPAVRSGARPWVADRVATTATVLAFALGLTAFVLYPLVEILRRSIEGPTGATLRHYTAFLGTPQVFAALGRSLWIASLSTVLTILLAFTFAYVMARVPLPGRGVYARVALLALVPAAVPGTVMGLGYVLAFNKLPLILTGTATIVVLNHLFRFFPLGLLTSRTRLKQLDPALEEACQSLRTPLWRILARVIFPLARPAVAASIVYIFIRSMVTLSAVIFLVSPDISLAAVSIMLLVNDGKLNAAAAMSVVVVLVILVVLAFAELLGRTIGGGHQSEHPEPRAG